MISPFINSLLIFFAKRPPRCFCKSARCGFAASCLMLTLLGCGCERTHASGAKPGPSPATVTGAMPEAALSTVRLTPEAQTRLGLATATVEAQPVSRLRTWAGEVVVPQGQLLTVTAPFSGRVLLPPHQDWVTAGRMVNAGEPLALLQPAVVDNGQPQVFSTGDRLTWLKLHADLTAAQADADGQVVRAEVQVDAGRIRVNRAKELLEENVGSQRVYDDAQAELAGAVATLDAANKLRAVLRSIEAGSFGEEAHPLELRAPIGGVIREIHVAPDMVVGAGAPLFQLFQPNPVWIRVPVFTGELSVIQDVSEAYIGNLATPAGPTQYVARRISAPPSANSQTDTVDLFFELANPEGAWHPGERVAVSMRVGDSVSRPVVPWSAVVFDINGGSWVYEVTEPNVFARRRVEVERVDEGHAVLHRGPTVGTQVVASAVAELYGTEFGVGK